MESTIQAQRLLANQLEFQKIQAKSLINEFKHSESTSDLNTVKGIGPATLEKLRSNGITTRKQLEEMTREEIGVLIDSPFSLKTVLKSLNK